jgi:Rps23 Pro-64 3,4-dihydroxylase Tpa1-like proline 4-hydroxylase
MSQVTDEDIVNCNTDIFGEWIVKENQKKSLPFDHIVINNFLTDTYYNLVKTVLPETPTDEWYKYENPLEVKYLTENLELMHPLIRNIFYALSHKIVIDKLKNIFNLDDLQYDPYLHGAGLHYQPRYGRLNMHLDYEKHPHLKNKQRKLNIILYLNEDWNKKWNGDTQLWNKDMTECVFKSFPTVNTAIIFYTGENSWHGVPETILCPEYMYRKTLTFYYVSDLINEKNSKKYGNVDGYRSRASFIKRPSDQYDERMNKLYEIRPIRRITNKDMENIWPDWKPDTVLDRY